MSQSLVAASSYPIVVGRYALFDAIASGGMASVHIGRLLGSFGFTRTVAIKRLHPSMARDPEFLSMFQEEARLAARISHPHVVTTLDVVALDGELLLVMEYVSGASLSRVLLAERAAGRDIPHRIAVDIMLGVLNGLHAAHEAKNERGEPLGIVHRDVSPHNILIGSDGTARVLDFGIAKAVGGANLTRPDQIKGKLRYLSPESLTKQPVTRASDIFAASLVLWEMLAGRRLFDGEGDGQVLNQILNHRPEPPSRHRPHLPRTLDEIVMRGLATEPRDRYPTARAMALALEAAVTPVNRSVVSEWLENSVGEEIHERDALVAGVERKVQAESKPENTGVSTLTGVPLKRADVGVASASESVSAPSFSLPIERPSQRADSVVRARWLQLAVATVLAGTLVVALAAQGRQPAEAPLAAELPHARELPPTSSPSPAVRAAAALDAAVRASEPAPTTLDAGAPTLPAPPVAAALVAAPPVAPPPVEVPPVVAAPAVAAPLVAPPVAPPPVKASKPTKPSRKSIASTKAPAAKKAPPASSKPKKAPLSERIYRRD
jgi:serine/threonine-protein kinase